MPGPHLAAPACTCETDSSSNIRLPRRCTQHTYERMITDLLIFPLHLPVLSLFLPQMRVCVCVWLLGMHVQKDSAVRWGCIQLF